MVEQMIKVHINPNFIGSTETGGIRRVVDAMLKYFPDMGIEHTMVPRDADVLISHGGSPLHYRDKPILNVNHGLMWSRQPWGLDMQDVNQKVINAMRMAQAHTSPSEWVSRAIRRGGLFYPKVVYHGVDADQFEPGENQKYVLWNKARADHVSDPTDMMNIARHMPTTQFWTTIGRSKQNVNVIGVKPYEEMKDIVRHAGVYLCTARETFGIGTLEAMAAGVPVAGWAWGGQLEIIKQGETGYLATPGDYSELNDCIQRCLAERDRLGANAHQDALERWTWEPRIQQYADIVRSLHAEHNNPLRPRVSIIVTAYNLDKYLPDCLDSVCNQSYKDFECLVVDDAGSDKTAKLVEHYSAKEKRIRYVRPPHNLGLPGARNLGLEQSNGYYIRHLDADDYLADNAIQLEVDALQADPTIHIAYGHLETINEDGSRITDERGNVLRSGWPTEQFDWYKQMAHLNQLPSCCMMRREVLERIGGYRERMKRNEDAEFWCRATSLGFQAKKITQAVTYFHRRRNDSKGELEWKNEGPEGDWTSWFPWRLGASTYNEAPYVLKRLGGRHPRPHVVPFAAQGDPGPGRRAWYVHDYAYPVVSVIVTVGPGHEKYMLDALDSIQAQTFTDWECIVVNDTGKMIDPDIPGAPWARVINMPGNQGASAARNAGIKQTTGKYVVWLDADDYWLPWFLERMVATAEENDGIIFCDLIEDHGDRLSIYQYGEFDQTMVIKAMRYPGSSVLIPQKVIKAVLEKQGGWDIQIPGMEDWDFQIAMHDAGFCAYHIPEALFVYRLQSSTKRKKDHAKIDDILQYIDEKWHAYRKEGKKMGCGCRKKTLVKSTPQSALSSSGNFANDLVEVVSESQMVDVEYMGPITSPFRIDSKVSRNISYRFANNQHNKVQTVLISDARFLESLVGPDTRPLYRIITGKSMENRDPTAALGRPIG